MFLVPVSFICPSSSHISSWNKRNEIWHDGSSQHSGTYVNNSNCIS